MPAAISSMGSSCQASAASYQSKRAKGQQDLQALADALKSNDLQGAQDAFAAFQKDLPQPNGDQQTGQNSGPKGQAAADLQSLAQALSSGNVADAQAALAKFQQDAQAIGKGRHHHRHGSGGQVGSTAPPPPSPSLTADASGGSLDSNADADQSTPLLSIDLQA